MPKLSLLLTPALALLALVFAHPFWGASGAQTIVDAAALVAPGTPFSIDDQVHAHQVLDNDETRWPGKFKVTNEDRGKLRAIVHDGRGNELSDTVINAMASDTTPFPKSSSVENRQVSSGTRASGFYGFP